MATKIKFEDVKSDISNVGWQLISTEYVNLKTDLELLCPEGHTNYVNYEKWRRGNYECPICKQNPFTKTDASVVKKQGYRILAFDQASITSGYSVFDDQKLITYGKHTTDGTKSTERIAKTKYWVASLIKKWNPDEIVFEDIQLQKFQINGMEGDAVLTFKKLAHLQGVLKNYCYELGIPYTIVPAATWRAFSEVKGKARADKKRSAQLIIKKYYDVSVTQDEADAILLCRYAAAQHDKTKIVMF